MNNLCEEAQSLVEAFKVKQAEELEKAKQEAAKASNSRKNLRRESAEKDFEYVIIPKIKEIAKTGGCCYSHPIREGSCAKSDDYDKVYADRVTDLLLEEGFTKPYYAHSSIEPSGTDSYSDQTLYSFYLDICW